MKLLDIFSRKSAPAPIVPSTLSTPESWFLDMATVPVSSGVSVTPQTAMRCAPVRAAVQAIAETVGQLPMHVFMRSADGSKERDPAHPVYRLVHDEVNDLVTAGDFREQLTRDALLHGNGYAYVSRVNGRPFALYRLAPEAVTVSVNGLGEPTYKFQPGTGAAVVYSAADVLHLKGPSLDGVTGTSPIREGREAIGLALAMEGHAARLFGNGARPSGLLTLKSNGGSAVPPEAVLKAKKIWHATHGGSNSGGTAILDGDVTFTGLTMTSVDSQFLELRAFAVSEIARLFRVPPVFLQDYGRATWGNSEHMGQQFLTYCLMPWLKRWEGEIRLKLFAPEERAGHFAEFLTDDLLRADFATRMKGHQIAIAARILNPNEVRAMENRAPYAGGEVYANPNTTAGATVARESQEGRTDE